MMKPSNETINLTFLAKKYLLKLGNLRPSGKHIRLMYSLLTTTVFPIEKILIFNSKLTRREVACLLLIAQGKRSQEVAEILGTKISTIRTYRKQIISKLNCSSMAQAVYEGIRYGHIPKS
jgi:DNA-binding CsgD family transcriptional regulator